MNIYSISDQQMLLSNAFPPPQIIPSFIEEIDTEEKKILEEENQYIKKYSQQKITAVKVLMVVSGLGLGITISMLTAPLLPFEIDTIAHIGMFVGSIAGYFIGKFMDDSGASRRLAIFAGRISEKRITRFNEKLDQIGKMIADNTNKELITTSQKYIENILEGKGPYNRFLEFFNINMNLSKKNSS